MFVIHSYSAKNNQFINFKHTSILNYSFTKQTIANLNQRYKEQKSRLAQPRKSWKRYDLSLAGIFQSLSS